MLLKCTVLYYNSDMLLRCTVLCYNLNILLRFTILCYNLDMFLLIQYLLCTKNRQSAVYRFYQERIKYFNKLPPNICVKWMRMTVKFKVISHICGSYTFPFLFGHFLQKYRNSVTFLTITFFRIKNEIFMYMSFYSQNTKNSRDDAQNFLKLSSTIKFSIKSHTYGNLHTKLYYSENPIKIYVINFT